MGYLRKHRPTKIRLTTAQKIRLLLYARAMQYLTPEDWKAMMFTGEVWCTGVSYRPNLTIHEAENIDDLAAIRERPNG
jgi:hypothetical protein